MENEEQNKFMSSVTETIKTIFYALLIAGIFRTVFFQPFWIPSASMKDTLLVGDFVFVNKMVYGYSYASCPKIQIPAFALNIDADDFCGFIKNRETRILGSDPERGDVVVFRHPRTGVDFIKRLIGLPGDKIKMQDGLLLINDTPVDVHPDGEFSEIYEPQGSMRSMPACKQGAVRLGGECLKDKFIETLPNGVAHSILNIGDGPVDNTKTFTVPQGHYFFIGDNRDNSGDSRGGVGFVPQKDIIGRADRIIVSSAGRSMLAFWTWRSDRYFKAVE